MMTEVSHARAPGESQAPPRVGGSVRPAEGRPDVGVPTDGSPICVCVACDEPIAGVRVIPEAGAMHPACAYQAMRGARGAFIEPAYSFARWCRLGEAWCLDFWRNVRDASMPRRPVDAT